MLLLKNIAKADVIEGAVKAFSVLEAFSAERQRLNATQVAQRTSITRAAARRHLLTLQALGYLESDQGFYWLGVRVLRLAGNYLASARLPRVVQPMLNRLGGNLNCAVSVAVLDDADVVIVARSAEQRHASRALPFGTHLGARLPAFATSTGRVLLAQRSKTELANWLKGRVLARLTPHTVCNKAQWNALVAAVAVQGYCVANQEHELGVQALAVPVRDNAGAVIAALNVVLASDTAQPAKILSSTPLLAQRYLHSLLAAADEVRAVL